MMKKLILLLLLVSVLIGCQNGESSQNNKDQLLKVVNLNTGVEIIADNLNIPWSINKDGAVFYLSERPGSIAKISNGNVTHQKVSLEKQLSTAAEAGLLGFVLSPNFSETNEAFAYYTYTDSKGQFNRIVILKLDQDVWREEKLLLDKIPSGRFHHGGRLKIGLDGKLYATTGDALQSSIAQDLNSLGGKILRINLDGSIPNDNPFPNSYVYSFGHRNPQGITWSTDGKLYESEHGNSANDEINQILAGQNYGWPIIEGLEEQHGMYPPLFTSGPNKTWAPSGLAYYDGKLYVAALRGEMILEFNPETKEFREFLSGLGRIRDIYIEDHILYFITNNTDGRGKPLNKDDKLYQINLSEVD